MTSVSCRRCGRSDAPALDGPPVPGPAGALIARQTCRDCWAEWEAAEVMVINELRLNFMDPASRPILQRHMSEFLNLDTENADPEA